MDDNMFLRDLSEKVFFDEYKRALEIVDSGVKSWFIMVDNFSAKNIDVFNNTLLKDIEKCFGSNFIPSFNFAQNYNGLIQTFRIRRISKTDKSFLRDYIKFFPEDCWVVDWKEKDSRLTLPFIQNNNGEIVWLLQIPKYRKNFEKEYDCFMEKTAQQKSIKHIIETFPDYFYCVFALVKYKNVDIVIPIPSNSAKKTFKNREKDRNGVKRHLVHNVKEHSRKNLKNVNSVYEHRRGISDLVINGISVTLVEPFNWSEEDIKRFFAKLKRGDAL